MKKYLIGLLLIVVLVGALGFYNYSKKPGETQGVKDQQITELQGKLAEAEKTIVDLRAQAEIAAATKSQINSTTTVSSTAPPSKKTNDLLAKIKNLDLTKFQSVQLVDNKTFFGKIKSYDSDFLVLDDVYYIQTGTGTNPDQATSLSLIKRGNEINGPKDPMVINTANVLYVETMKDDSQIVMAINQYESQQ